MGQKAMATTKRSCRYRVHRLPVESNKSSPPSPRSKLPSKLAERFMVSAPPLMSIAIDHLPDPTTRRSETIHPTRTTAIRKAARSRLTAPWRRSKETSSAISTPTVEPLLRRRAVFPGPSTTMFPSPWSHWKCRAPRAGIMSLLPRW
jgi:hypothetical protein